MYSSNEYESLELEPKLLISVSALFYPNRRWYGAVYNGSEWSWGVWFLCLVFDMVDWRKRPRRGDCSIKVTPDKMHVNKFHNCLDFGILWPELDNGNRHFWKAYRILVRPCGSLECSIYSCLVLVTSCHESILQWGSWVQPADSMNCQDMLGMSADLQGHISILCQYLEQFFSCFFPNTSLLELEQNTRKILKNHWVDLCRYVMTSWHVGLNHQLRHFCHLHDHLLVQFVDRNLVSWDGVFVRRCSWRCKVFGVVRFCQGCSGKVW